MFRTFVLSLFVVAADESLVQLIPRIEHAMITGSVEQLEQYRGTLLASVDKASGNEAMLMRYTLAYVDWRLYPLLMSDPKKRGDAYLKEAEKQLTELVKADPGNAEAHALLSTVYGQEIGTSAWRGMLIGPKTSSSIATALKLAKDNPRVALQAGVGALFTPKMFGGGIDKAEKELRRAEMLFSKEPSNQSWPNWGRLDVLAWMGQLLATKGDLEGARAYYQRALTLQPDYGWIRFVLLPALDKPAKKK
jgi:tetratricopeptide (TPR) repeat protein